MPKRERLERQMIGRLRSMAAYGVKKSDRRPDQITSYKTMETYAEMLNQAGREIGRRWGAHTLEAAHEYVQPYLDLLREQKSACTVHTACAALCKLYQEPMGNYTKAVRRYTDATKGRGHPPTAPLSEVQSLCYDIGIRRAELMRLRARDIMLRPEGLCAHVTRGKGGKEHYQLILPSQVADIKACLQGKHPDDFLIPKENSHGTENLQAIRRAVAQESYAYYSQRLEIEGESYRDQLKKLCFNRMHEFHRDERTNHDWRIIDHPYVTRPPDGSASRTYDRLALMATSIFHLSHWRCNVTARYYMQ